MDWNNQAHPGYPNANRELLRAWRVFRRAMRKMRGHGSKFMG